MTAADGSTPDAGPYPGLRSFHADETHLFFGRDEQRNALLQRLRQARFLAIVGSSGSGKSSLVRAGLLPGLHGGFMAGPSGHWRIADLRPGTDAIGNLARALDAPGVLRDRPPGDDEPSFTEATLRRSGLGLVEAVREAQLPAGERLLVLVDQFEELFRALEADQGLQRSDEAEAFVSLLLEATRQDAFPIYVVLTMRSDFLGECARFRDLPEAINEGQYLVPRLTPDQRAEAITGPAAVYGVRLAPTLVNRLLHDAGESPDQLPLLQHALMRTWQAWRRRSGGEAPAEIGLDDYEAVGGVASALSQHADAVLAGLSEGVDAERAAVRQTIAERLFKLLSAVSPSGAAVRRFTTVQEIADVSFAPIGEVMSVVEAFRARGQSFLMPPPDKPLTPTLTLDISHESLIRNWPRMTAWLGAEAESARVYERLSSTALLQGKGEAGLWDQPDLGVALKWREREQPNPAWARRYNLLFAAAMGFLEASRAHAWNLEAARGGRRRSLVFTISILVMTALAGTAMDFAKDRKSTTQTKQRERAGQAELATLQTFLEIERARDAGIQPSSLKLCAVPPGGFLSSTRTSLFSSLCDPNKTIEPSQRLQLRAYRHIVEGKPNDVRRMLEASRADMDVRDLVDLMQMTAFLKPPAPQAERDLLMKLDASKRTAAGLVEPSAEERESIGTLVNPVHRRMADALTSASAPPLSKEERALLELYQNAKPDGDIQGAGREKALTLLDELRLLPDGDLFGDLGQAALSYQPGPTAPKTDDSNVYGLLVILLLLLVWPAWWVRRKLQLRSDRTIPVRPNPIRRLLAAGADVGFAIVAAGATAIFLTSLVDLTWFSLHGGSEVLDTSYEKYLFYALFWLCLLTRDNLHLRLRRSLGKVMFDLYPTLPRQNFWPSTLISIRRHALIGGLGVLVATSDFLLSKNPDQWPPAVKGASAILAILLLVDFAGIWRRSGQTFSDQLAGSRVIDADAAETFASMDHAGTPAAGALVEAQRQ